MERTISMMKKELNSALIIMRGVDSGCNVRTT